MDYIRENQYNAFLAKQNELKIDMDRYVNECLLLANPEKKDAFNEMVSMNEAASDSIKNGFKKIAEFIKKIWAKFVEKLTNLMASNKTYLEKYKDIILKKKPLEATYTMRNYPEGIKNIVSTSVPMFNYSSLKEKLSDAITFNKFLTQGKNPAYSEKVEFADYCKDLFRGSTEDKEFKSTELNMTDIYNYCYNYNKMQETIEKDKTTLEKAAIDAGRVIDSIKPAEQTTTTTTTSSTSTEGNKTEGNAGGTDNKQANAESTLFADKTVYSAVYEQYITEVEINKAGGATASKSSADTTPASTTAAANVSNITKDTKAATADETKAAVGQEIDDAKNRINVYMDSCRTLMAAKLTVSEEIYKNYMQIIRSHVNDFIGTSGAKDQDKVQQAATNYAKLSEEEKAGVDKYLGGQQGVVNNDIDYLNQEIDKLVASGDISKDYAEMLRDAAKQVKGVILK